MWQVEYKGLTAPSWLRFEAPAAKVQVLVTQWVWTPIWKHFGWDVAEYVECEFYNLKDARFLERQRHDYRPEFALDQIEDAFALYDGQRKPIRPAIFKCRGCRKKAFCSIYKAPKKKKKAKRLNTKSDNSSGDE